MGKLEDDAILEGMREAVAQFNPAALLNRVYTVWRDERWEARSLIGIASSIEVAKVMAENVANKDNITLKWETKSNGQEKYLSADVTEILSYTVWVERVVHLIVKDPPLTAPPAVKEYDFLPSSKYGVICRNCGKQGMTYEEYMDQLAAMDSLWKCIHCGEAAEFDEGRYEAGGL